MSVATPGWFSIAIGILFLVFLQTGTLTLMTLMLSGVIKSKSASNEELKLNDFIKSVTKTIYSAI